MLDICAAEHLMNLGKVKSVKSVLFILFLEEEKNTL